MTNECRPPEGTADDTYHLLRTETDEVCVCRWRHNTWLFSGRSFSVEPIAASACGWRYSHAIDLSPPAAPINDRELVEALITAFSQTDDRRSGWLAAARKARELLQGGTAPAAPDPLQPLRDAVVEKARAFQANQTIGDGGYTQMRDLIAAVDALNAAEAPPDPVAELRAVWEDALPHLGPDYHRNRMEAAIAALEAGRKA